MSKSTLMHFRKSTGRMVKCDAASPETCRAEPIDGEDSPRHFSTPEEGYAYLEKKYREEHGDFAMHTKRSESPVQVTDNGQRTHKVILDGQEITREEADRRLNLRAFASDKLKQRTEQELHTMHDPMSPETTKKKHEKAMEAAAQRDNTVLMRQLSNATVYPSSVITTESGKKFNVNEVVRLETEQKHLDAQRKNVEDSIKKFVTEHNPEHGSYTAEVDGVKASISVRAEADSKALKSLQENNDALWQKISKDGAPKYTMSSLKAAGFTDNELNALEQETQVYNTIIAKTPDVGQGSVKGNTDFGTGDTKTQLNTAAKNLATVVSDSRQTTGKSSSDRKKEMTEQKDIAKNATLEYDQTPGSNGIAILGQAHGNGGFINSTKKKNTSRASVEKILGDNPKLKDALIIERSLDKKKAEKELTPDQYQALFSKTAVGFRVVEPK